MYLKQQELFKKNLLHYNLILNIYDMTAWYVSWIAQYLQSCKWASQRTFITTAFTQGFSVIM